MASHLKSELDMKYYKLNLGLLQALLNCMRQEVSFPAMYLQQSAV